MFSFFDCFDKITGDTLTLKIIEKNPGDDQAIPFYYYDIYKNDSDQPIGKISIRIGHNFHSYYNGNLGYEIDEPYRGHHYAMIACQMLLPVAKAHGGIIWTLPATRTTSPPIKRWNTLAQNYLKYAMFQKLTVTGKKE